MVYTPSGHQGFRQPSSKHSLCPGGAPVLCRVPSQRPARLSAQDTSTLGLPPHTAQALTAARRGPGEAAAFTGAAGASATTQATWPGVSTSCKAVPAGAGTPAPPAIGPSSAA